MKVYIKMEKTIIKFGDIEKKKKKIHQHKRPISIKKIQILIEKQYLVRSALVKRVLNISLATKFFKKIDLKHIFSKKECT